MAISDVLSDAVAQIRVYLDSQPTMYLPIRPEVEELLAKMDALRFKLDSVPSLDDPTGPSASVLEALEYSLHGWKPTN